MSTPRQFVKWMIRLTPLRTWLESHEKTWPIREWRRKGCPVPPPPIVKLAILVEYVRRYRLEVFVETGTYRGDTADGMRMHVSQVYSIELCPELYRAAQRRFDGCPQVELIHGDSGRELVHLIMRMERPALFWLDAHYSGEGTARGLEATPIMQEISAILDSRQTGHVILIDDARIFGRDPAYPSLDDIRSLVAEKRPGMHFVVRDDIIRIAPD